MKETDISKAIIETYYAKLSTHLENDVVIVGAGPAGLIAAYYLGKSNIKTTVIEKKLSIGGGIWGGASGYNIVVFEDNDITDEIGIHTKKNGDLYLADAIEFATVLAHKAIQAGAAIFNLVEAEDIIIKDGVVKGAVVNSTTIRMAGLPVDPFSISSKCLIDSTGHPAEIVSKLKMRKPEMFPNEIKDAWMDVERSEEGVVEKTSEIYPGLYVAGMSACATFNLPRMGPIFGGMLKSGKKVADLIKKKLKK